MSIQINKSAYEKLIKEDIEWLLSNTKDSLERRHIVEVLNYSPERLYASGSSEIPNDLEEAAKAYADDTNPTDSFYEAFKEGALWMREQMMKELSEKIASAYQLGLADKEKQMMKEAVEGNVVNTNYPTQIQLNIFESSLKDGQKVKLIIVKEAGK